MCAFDTWLHEEAGYTYHGDAPITGLTRFEIDKLQLGYFVRQEQQTSGRGGYGEQSYSQQRTRSHKRSIEQRLRAQ